MSSFKYKDPDTGEWVSVKCLQGPPGEAGGGTANEWKKIRTITVPEDVTTDTSDIAWYMSTLEDHTNEPYGFVFSTTDDGSEFAVRELYIIANVADVTTNYFGINDQNATNYGGHGNLGYQRISPTLSKYVIHISTFGERSLYRGYIGDATSSRSSIFQKITARKDEDIKSLWLGVFSNNALITGSTFEVWGI